MKPEDVGLTPELPYFRATMGNRTPAITYLHLYESDKFSVSIPLFKNSMKNGPLVFAFINILLFLRIVDGDFLLAAIGCHSASQSPGNDGFQQAPLRDNAH